MTELFTIPAYLTNGNDIIWIVQSPGSCGCLVAIITIKDCLPSFVSITKATNTNKLAIMGRKIGALISQTQGTC